MFSLKIISGHSKLSDIQTTGILSTGHIGQQANKLKVVIRASIGSGSFD